MTAANQYELHPDAESLNAFAEQALGERERTAMLEHLAVCGRCRQIVTLAQESAAADAVPELAVAAATPMAAPQPRRAWWKSWWIATAPLGAMAMTTLAVFLYVRHSQMEMARNAPVAEMRDQRMAPSAQENEKAAASPAPHAAGGAMATGPRDSREKKPAAPQAGEAQTAGLMAAAPEPPPSAANEQARVRELAELPEAAAAPLTETQWQEKKQLPLAAQQQPGKDLADKRPPAAKAAAAPSAPASANAQVTVASAAPMLEAQPVASAGVLGRQHIATFSATRAERVLRLPGGAAAVSFASIGDNTLAIDKAGTLYRSIDRGTTWNAVLQQWAGRAVTVRTTVPATGSSGAAQAEAANGSSDSGVPQPVFEILNDKNQSWLSTDGTVWTAK